jgi:hypothetical protein
MTSELAILVPVLGRPQNVVPLLEHIERSTPKAAVYFIPNPDDVLEIEAIEYASGSILFTSTGGYAEKINQAVEETSEPYLFFGADDLEPQSGWFEAARAVMVSTGAQVVGVNDMIKRDRLHATHFLITRSYAMRPLCDGGRGPLCEDYDHSCTDDELIATAVHRRTYAYAEDALVRHLHPDNKTAPLDPTYEKGRAQIRRDRKLWRSRRYWYIERHD